MKFVAPIVALAAASHDSSVHGSPNLVLNGREVAHCTKPQVEAWQASVVASAAFAPCLADAGVSANATSLSPTAEAKLVASTNCQTLYTDAQALAATQDCFEFDVFQNVTWRMVTPILDMAVVPHVSDKCDKQQLVKSFLPLVFSPHAGPCLADIGLSPTELLAAAAAGDDDDVIQRDQVPASIDQLEAVRHSADCRAWYGDIHAAVEAFPHCAVDKNGTDIHVFGKLPFDTLLDWAELGVTLENASFVTHSSHAALQLAASYVHHDTPSSSSPAFVAGYMAAGAIVAAVAVLVYQRRQPAAGYETIHSTMV
ncbi:Aste57867_1193 [Aphanomyces stellatus]|uniref:Aste57867_1193 protein n=1 Tax=Aphanomyces stellatus TaxID=120398 RepID=A0A485K510_9STRA|nr:hypothetical protein As57867_001192 [Aphanomyces stellatus]VFT78413.1 Aste57867_1193 [Aphanomyces stellatus]